MKEWEIASAPSLRAEINVNPYPRPLNIPAFLKIYNDWHCSRVEKTWFFSINSARSIEDLCGKIVRKRERGRGRSNHYPIFHTIPKNKNKNPTPGVRQNYM